MKRAIEIIIPTIACLVCIGIGDGWGHKAADKWWQEHKSVEYIGITAEENWTLPDAPPVGTTVTFSPIKPPTRRTLTLPDDYTITITFTPPARRKP